MKSISGPNAPVARRRSARGAMESVVGVAIDDFTAVFVEDLHV
jgi:hypothetical protein